MGIYIRLQYITSSILIQNVSKTLFGNNSFIKIITILYFSFSISFPYSTCRPRCGCGQPDGRYKLKNVSRHLNLVGHLNAGFEPEIPTTTIVVYHDLTLLFSVAFENTRIALWFSLDSCIMV